MVLYIQLPQTVLYKDVKLRLYSFSYLINGMDTHGKYNSGKGGATLDKKACIIGA